MSQVMQFRTPEQAKAYADSMDQHWRKTNAQYGSGAYTPPSISKNQYGQYSVGQQSPGQAQPRQSPYESSTAYQAWNPNIANNPSAPRPPAFQASYGNLDGTTSQQPNFQQRDAFISQINNQLGRMQQQSWQQPMGAPQFDFPGMASRANEMVQGGLQSPLAPTNPRQPSPIGSALPAPPDPAGDQVRRLLPYRTMAEIPSERSMPPAMPPDGHNQIATARSGEQFRIPDRPPADKLGWLGGAGPVAPRPPAAGSQQPPTSTWQMTIDTETQRSNSSDPQIRADALKRLQWAKDNMRREQEYLKAMEGYDIGNPASRDRVQRVLEKHQREVSQAGRTPEPPPPGWLEPTPRPTKPRPPANPFPGMSVALPPGMNMSQFTRQLDGSYLPGGVTRRPSMTPRPPRTINWGEMTPDEIAATRSPYLGGRIPTVRNYGG